MPRYVVEREFVNGLEIPIDDRGVQAYLGVDKRKTLCIYDAPLPDAIRITASRNKLPIQRITEVRVLDPYFYLSTGSSR